MVLTRINSNDKKLAGLVALGPISLFPDERGLRRDPLFHDPRTGYMLDLTLTEECRGLRFGFPLKAMILEMSHYLGIQQLVGRNRQQLARKMWEINLSLGAVETDYQKEDYLDDEVYRDVHHYHLSTGLQKVPLYFYDAQNSPLGEIPSEEFRREDLAVLVNKICLSNFVSTRYLNHLKSILDLLPTQLRHGYSASGQSECVDKIFKSLWATHAQTDKNSRPSRNLTFHNHFFGQGSFMARSLSHGGVAPKEALYFPTTHLEDPTTPGLDSEKLLNNIEVEFKKGDVLAVWLEPLTQKHLRRVPENFLKRLRNLCHQYNVSLVFNETTSSMYRYSEESFVCAQKSEWTPDAGFMYLGGQAAVCFLGSERYLSKPLMMISTWDGDEFSLSLAHQAISQAINNKDEYLKLRRQFHQKLVSSLKVYGVDCSQLNNGFGVISGSLPGQLAQLFKRDQMNHYCLPSIGMMKAYLCQ